MHTKILYSLLAIIVTVLVLVECRSAVDNPRHMKAPELEEFSKLNAATAQSGDQADVYYYYSAAQQALKSGQVEDAVWLLEKAVAIDSDSLLLKLELAEDLISSRHPDRALVLLEKVLAKEPGNVDTLILIGKIYQQRQDIKSAVEYYEKALSLDPKNQNVYILLGRIYWDANDTANAQRVFQRMAQNLPDAYVAYYFLGKIFIIQNKLDSAVIAFKKSLELEPSLVEPRLELIEIYKTRKQRQLIPGLYQEILDYNPQNYKVALDLAANLYRNERPDEAIPYLVHLGRQSRQEPEIIVLLFEKYIQTKQYKIAVWIIEGMLKGEPDSSDLHYLAGVAYDGLEKTKFAIDHLIQVNIDSRFYPNAVIHCALLYHQSGRSDLALAELEQALDKMPGQADFYYYLASLYEEQNRLEDAIRVLNKGLSVAPENVRMLFKLGVIEDKAGHRDKSIETMKAVIRLAPDHSDALNYLGYTYADMGINLDEAEALIRMALKNKPDSGYITDSLGWIFFKRGEYNKALDTMLKAIKLIPEDPAILEHTGDVYQKLNQPDQAVKYYQHALKLKSDDRKTLQEKLRKLGAPEADTLKKDTAK